VKVGTERESIKIRKNSSQKPQQQVRVLKDIRGTGEGSILIKKGQDRPLRKFRKTTLEVLGGKSGQN